jgi:hypothetical protein
MMSIKEFYPTGGYMTTPSLAIILVCRKYLEK